MSGGWQRPPAAGAREGWDSFWDLATPQAAAEIMLKMYRTEAISAARRCAEAARDDGRDDDHRFWTAVLARIAAKLMSRPAKGWWDGHRGKPR